MQTQSSSLTPRIWAQHPHLLKSVAQIRMATSLLAPVVKPRFFDVKERTNDKHAVRRVYRCRFADLLGQLPLCSSLIGVLVVPSKHPAGVFACSSASQTVCERGWSAGSAPGAACRIGFFPHGAFERLSDRGCCADNVVTLGAH